MMIVENETGILFPTGDADGLYEALRKILADERQLKLMGEAAKRRYTELYSLEKTASQLRQVFFQITGDNKRVNQP
jgi:glycosyltransferase involved in cell wall biosynthesis